MARRRSAKSRLGLPGSDRGGLLVGWFALNMLAAAKVEHAVIQTRDLVLTGGFSIAVVTVL